MLESWLLTSTVKGSLLIVAVMAILGMFSERIPPRWRHALIVIALLRLVLPVAPQSSISLFNLAPAMGGRFEVVESAAAVIGAPRDVIAVPARSIIQTARTAEPWVPLALGLWATGAALLLARMFWQSARLWRHVAAARTLDRPDLKELLDQCCARIGVRRDIRLVECERVTTPSLHGLARPVLLLPRQTLEELSLTQLRFVFLHEVAHLRRFDVLVNWLSVVAHALHWFNPLVWIAVSRLAEERELACDALSLEQLPQQERRDYGETVLQALNPFRAPVPLPSIVGMTTSKQQLRRRILMIASFRNETKRSMWFAAAVILLGAVTLTDAAAGERHFIKQIKPLSAEARQTVEKLHASLSVKLTEASIDDILAAITSHTGVVVDAAVIGDEARQARFNLNAKEIPAQMLLMESLDALNLGVAFDELGRATVVKAEGNQRIFTQALPAPPPGEQEMDRVIVIRKADHAAMEGQAIKIGEDVIATPPVAKRILIRKADAEANAGADGVMRRKLVLRDGAEGQAESSLELEVRGAPAVSAH